MPIVFSVAALAAPALAESLTAPPPPAIAPLVAETYPSDADRDRIEDELASKARDALAALKAAINPQQKAAAETALANMVDVELVFRQPVTPAQIDRFIALGGEITYLYKAVSRGWNGRIPLGKVGAVPAAMGEALVMVEEPKPATTSLYEATRTGRVRPIWASGFAGSVSGFEGDTNITIAVIDTEADETHSDLTGRRVYWRNFTDEPAPGSGPAAFHATMVTGVAVGTGTASGTDAGTLYFTQSDTLSGRTNGQVNAAAFMIPAGEVTLTMTGKWLGGGSTIMAWALFPKGTAITSPYPPYPGQVTLAQIYGESPLTLTCTVTGDVNQVYVPMLEANGSNTDFVVTCQASNYPNLGDGFNKLRGVAPGCNWANAKVVRDDGVSQTTWIGAAIDDLASQRVARNVKVMNLSLGWNSLTLRQKVNSAVNLGIVVTAAAGNGALNTTEAQRQIIDPARAAFALTVGAANDDNQLTEYSSYGVTPTYWSGPYAEDYKPDLLAPGGSSSAYPGIMAPDSNYDDGPAFADQQPNDYRSAVGTSFSAPFAAGSAALVIDALQKQGLQWDFTSNRHALLVKMVLCATATESDLPRASTNYNPTLERAANGPGGYPASKDRYEGYGMINPDAAVEAVSLTYTSGLAYTASLGPSTTDRRAWARTVNLAGGQLFYANLTVPATGDFDLYLYSTQPGTNGNPKILVSSTQAGNGVNETLNYLPTTNSTGIVVVKRVSGSGEFTFLADVAAPPLLASPTVNGSNLTLSFDTLAARTYSIESKNSLSDPAWQQLGSVLGDGTLKTMADSISTAGWRFYRLKVQ